jgi:hypothetical protein
MATVYRDPKMRSKINYITTSTFDNDLFVYTTSQNPKTFETTGNLAHHPSATSGNCPLGRVLRETGRVLYPGGAYPGVSTFMVAVYDQQSGLNGFIDPNSSNFAYYNVNKPIEVADGRDPNTGAPDKGMSIYTGGNITVWGDGDIYVLGTGNIGTVSGNITSGGNMVAHTGLTVDSGGIGVTAGNVTLTSGNLNITAGKLNVPGTGGAAIVGNASMASGSVVGGFRKLVVNTTAVTANSRIFLTYTGQNNAGILSAESIVAGTSFTIVSNNTSDGGTVSWFIVN